MIVIKFQSCSLRNYESLFQLIMFSLCCSSLILSVYPSITQLPFLTQRFSLAPNQRWIKMPSPACIIHNTDLNSPLFPLLPLLHCSSVTAAPPLNFLSVSLSLFLSSLQLSFSSKWTHHIRWFCYFFHAALCVITIFPALHLFIRISLCENTCMQGGCFQGYRGGTK